MPHLYFLADIHLSAEAPEITAAFRRALAQIAASKPDGVYILGDLFDAWLGDDLADKFAREIAASLAALPCPVWFQHGNRDFLLGEDFAREAGMTLLPERHVMEVAGRRILIEHGDLLCIHDHGYLRLRKILRHPATQALYRALPGVFKRRIAQKLRAQSKRRGARKDRRITDADANEVARILEKYRCDMLIHGHTHRAGEHDRRFVLGDWSAAGGVILQYRDGAWQLVQWPPCLSQESAR
ncbi:MAG: UDP-2,3-diacylglucosamine diphosphatase [Cardiobacteriaceae bacterium]|nr:UDP-2,3-diacylglucosamine diphosphatase [Cardiobacteriaceae bacterium]